MGSNGSKSPRITTPDPTFMEAVANALAGYRDGNNPDGKRLTDAELAERLGVSPPTFSKYLRRKMFIGGEPLTRAFIELGIVVSYREKEISARDFTSPPHPREPPAEQ